MILIILFTANFLPANAQDMTEDQQQVVQEFIDCIKKQQKEKLASKISFPFGRDYPIPTIKNKQEFFKRYSQVFDDKLIKMIVSSKPSEDWSAVGWRGIMFLRGDIWLDYDGTLIGVNYQSEFETKWKNKLIALEKSQIHESLRAFKEPVHVMETSKYRIRIDDMGDYTYRYAVWKIENKMSDKPDLIIINGASISEGSGGNHRYEFMNGDYKYECSIVVMAEDDSPPAYLRIYKDGKEILSQKAILVLK